MFANQENEIAVLRQELEEFKKKTQKTPWGKSLSC